MYYLECSAIDLVILKDLIKKKIRIINYYEKEEIDFPDFACCFKDNLNDLLIDINKDLNKKIL